MNDIRNESFAKEVLIGVCIGHNIMMMKKEVLGLATCKVNSSEKQKGNSELPEFVFDSCHIVSYSRCGWRRLIVEYTVKLMYLMEKCNQYFGMVSRYLASRDGKKKCNKRSANVSKVEFDGVNVFASGLVDQLGGINLFNLSMRKSCRVKWQQEASNCFLSFPIFVFYAKIVLNYIYFGVPVWIVNRNILGG